MSKTAYNKLALGGYTYIARNEVTRKSLLSNWDLTNSFQKRVQRIYLDEQEILFSESFSPFQAIVDWLALKTTVLKLPNFKIIVSSITNGCRWNRMEAMYRPQKCI